MQDQAHRVVACDCHRRLFTVHQVPLLCRRNSLLAILPERSLWQTCGLAFSNEAPKKVPLVGAEVEASAARPFPAGLIREVEKATPEADLQRCRGKCMWVEFCACSIHIALALGARLAGKPRNKFMVYTLRFTYQIGRWRFVRYYTHLPMRTVLIKPKCSCSSCAKKNQIPNNPRYISVP